MRKLVFILTILTFEVFASSYKINVTETYKNHSGQQGLEAFFIRLYEPLSIKPEFVYYPSKRGLQLVDQGKLDAEAGRFEMVANQYSNLIKIDEPIRVFHSGYYCLEKIHCAINQSTIVAAASGFQSAEVFCRLMKLNCKLESNPHLLARMLETQIAQVLISLNSEAEPVLCALKKKNIYVANIPDFTYPSFHYVHKRHAEHVPGLTQSMRYLRKLGTIPPVDVGPTYPRLSCNVRVTPI